jgi:1,2-diacylglycerol 3-alpha-glucosyltransferase
MQAEPKPSDNGPSVTPMRLGFFTEIYRPAVNGVVASVETLARGLRSRGHEVYCFAPRMPGGDDDGADVVRFPSLPLPNASPYRLTLPLVGRRNVNNVVKRLSLVHVHSLFVTGWAGLRYARRYNMPAVYTYHTQLEAYAHYVPFDAHATRFAASQLTRTFCNFVDAVIAPTPGVAAYLRDIGVETRIEIIASGIDIAHFASGARDESLRASLGTPRGGRLLLFVSRLAREKNVELLLRALAAVNQPDVHLAIAGDGPEREDLELLARDLGIMDRVRFLGVVGREALPHLYASADAFVFPSMTETQGLVQAEALAAGAHVIAADTPANREVVGDAGVIVAPTLAAFASALAAVPAERSAEGIVRARRAAERFSDATQVERTAGLYASLLDPRLDDANVCSV